MVFSTRLAKDGGPDRVRTDDLLDANQALSQLSYGPIVSSMDAKAHFPRTPDDHRSGLESRINSAPLRAQRTEMLTIGRSVERRSLERR
jgi:hypothetical protein